MKSLYLLIVITVITIAILIYAIVLLIKQFQSDLKAGKLAVTTATVIFFSVVATYLIGLFFKNIDVIEQVGSVDAWIGFAGAGMSGVITMLALYFTLEHSIKANQLSEKLIDMEETRYKLEMRPFAFVSNWEAFEITPKELVDDPTQKFIQIGEYKHGNALGIALELTNTTQSCIAVSYSCGKSRSINKNWGNAAVNQENLKMTLSSGEKDRFVFYASPDFMEKQLHNRVSVELILENRFAERYKETFELIITSLSNKVSLKQGKWHCNLFAQNYTIGRFKRNKDGEIECINETISTNE